VSLDQHLDAWLDAIKARVAPQTFNSYDAQLRVHIRPQLGQRKISDLRVQDIQRVYSLMGTQGLSPRTIRYAHAVLSMALKKALELNVIGKNPCDFVELPKLTHTERKAFSPGQASAFLRSAASDRHGLIFEFAMVTGMRPEEYLAVRWSDLDFASGCVTVQQALVWKKGGGFVFASPKTKKSRRGIPLPVALIGNLRKHRNEQLQDRLRLGIAYENLDLVFASEV
jgi:integrase